MFAFILSSSFVEIIKKLITVVVWLIAIVACFGILSNFLPNDPIQPYIDEWRLALRPYVALLNFFVPTGYCAFTLAFFVAWKYLIKPFQVFLTAFDPFGLGDMLTMDDRIRKRK